MQQQKEEEKVKDYQPPYQDQREGLSLDQVEGDPHGWHKEDIKNITDEASNRNADGILRQTLRGDETKGDPDERDIAGSLDYKDTPHGREETKQDHPGKANANG